MTASASDALTMPWRSRRDCAEARSWRSRFEPAMKMAALVFLTACASAPRPEPPLAGRVYQPSTETFVDDLPQRAARARYLLLGEKHDDPHAHEVQAKIYAGLSRPLIAEMLEEPQDFAQIAATWEKRGWPTWVHYAPIFRSAFDRGLPVIPGNLPRDRIRALVKASDPELEKRLGIDEPLPEPLDASLKEDLMASHCGHLPESMAPGMIRAQRARDAHMAMQMLGARESVLIAGNGHVRVDRGVPRELKRREPNAVLAIGIIQVEKGKHDPKAYALPYDLVIFTPAGSDEDPCAKMR
jgi:uncharacterized iron-regulated protein